MDRCSSCAAPITWRITKAGKRAPIDEAPVENGNVLIVETPAQAHVFDTMIGRAVTLSGAWLQAARNAGVDLYVNHWATCRDREAWRATQAAKRAGR